MATAQKMDADQDSGFSAAADAKGARKGGKKKMVLIGAVVAVLLGGGGIAYATGLVGKLTGGGAAKAEAGVPGSVELPEIVANLNAGARRSAFVRLKARLELASKTDEPAVIAGEPKVLDLFQTYLRDMRPEELRGSAGSYRLREELIARANIARAPAHVNESLFVEMLVQ